VSTTVLGWSPISSVTDAGHDFLGEVGHRLQQALHGQFPQRQLAQVLQRLGGFRGSLLFAAGHRGPPV
jgi:hypothetical protein